jgi:hypothetical protein
MGTINMPADKLNRINRILVIALTAWGLAVIVPEFYRVVGNYATLGFFADNDGRITEVQKDGPATAPGADMHEGDCIDLKQTKLADRLAVFGGMGGLTYVRPGLAIAIYVGSAPCETVSTRATKRELVAKVLPMTTANRVVLSLTQLAGIFFIWVGAVLVWQQPSAMTWGFFLYAIWFNPGQFFVFYAELQRYPWALLFQEFLQALAQALGYAGLVMFALRFPNNRLEPRLRIVQVWLLPVVVAVLLTLQLWSFRTGLGYPSESVSRWAYAGGYAVLFAVLVILGFREKHQTPVDKQRTRWVHWGCRIGLAAFIFADSNMATTWWEPIWEPFCGSGGPVAGLICDGDILSETTLLSVFLLDAVLAVAVLHAVRQHRVINVSFAFSRGATLILTWVIIAAVLTELSVKIDEAIHPLTEQFLWYFAAILLMKISFEWLHERLNDGCDRLFFRRLHHAEGRLSRIGDELVHATTFDAIDRQLIAEPTVTLDLASAAVFRREAGGAFRQYAQPIGWMAEHGRVIPLSKALERELNRGRATVRLRATDVVPSMPLEAAQPVVAAPIMGPTGLVAVAFYGAHSTGDDLTKEECELLFSLNAAAGTAYGRAEAQRLRRHISEVSAKLNELPYGIVDSA